MAVRGTITFIDDGSHVRVFITAHTASDGAVPGVAKGHVVGQRFYLQPRADAGWHPDAAAHLAAVTSSQA